MSEVHKKFLAELQAARESDKRVLSLRQNVKIRK